MPVLSKLVGLKDLLSPVKDIVKTFVKDPADVADAQSKILEIENRLASDILFYESTVVESQRDAIVAEAKSESWLTRNWRPIVMIWGMLLVTLVKLMDAGVFGRNIDTSLDPDFVRQMMALVTLGVGGYVVGRSGEKIVKEFRNTKAPTAMTAHSQIKRGKSEVKQAIRLRKAGFDDEQIEEILGVD